MKDKFLYLTGVSLKRKMKSKWFIVANILLAVAIIAVCNIDLIIKKFGGDFSDLNKIYVIDNTNSSYEVFNANMQEGIKQLSTEEYEISLITESKDEMVEKIKTDENEKNSIVLVFNNSDQNVLDVEMISNDFIDTISMSAINIAVNNTKTYLAILKYDISEDELAALSTGVEINRTILDENKDSTEENMNAIMSAVFPVFILPFFMLVIILVQMIGAEVNDEKTTRGMEIIISNVSPKVHFFSKCAAGNIFIISQLFLIIAYLLIGLFTRTFVGDTTVSTTMNQLSGLLSGVFSASFVSSLKYIIPLILILMILNLVAYSLLAGILASMTTNAEDFQQMQTPMMLIILLGYYLGVMAGTFDGSILIKVLGYIPFISAILSPSLLVIGQFTMIDMFISILLSVAVIFVLVRYGLRIYKVGILNYSSGNLWKKMIKALKNQEN